MKVGEATQDAREEEGEVIWHTKGDLPNKYRMVSQVFDLKFGSWYSSLETNHIIKSARSYH